MSFNANIPQVTDPTAQSFYQIRANFQAINAVFSNNHVGLTQDASISGKHRAMVFRPQGSDPTTSASQIALYNKLVTAVPELFFRPNNNQTPIQLTYPSINTGLQSTDPDVYIAQQYSFVAGPFVIYTGILKAFTLGTTVTLSPTTTLIHVDLIWANPDKIPQINPGIAATNLTGSSFTPDGAIGVKIDIFYTAVGV